MSMDVAGGPFGATDTSAVLASEVRYANIVARLALTTLAELNTEARTQIELALDNAIDVARLDSEDTLAEMLVELRFRIDATGRRAA